MLRARYAQGHPNHSHRTSRLWQHIWNKVVRRNPLARRALRLLARLGWRLLWRLHGGGGLGPVGQHAPVCGVLKLSAGRVAAWLVRAAAPPQHFGSAPNPGGRGLRLGRRPRCRPLSHRRHLWVVDDRLQSSCRVAACASTLLAPLDAACAHDLLHSRPDTARLRALRMATSLRYLPPGPYAKGSAPGGIGVAGGGILVDTPTIAAGLRRRQCASGSIYGSRTACASVAPVQLLLVSAGGSLGLAATFGTATVGWVTLGAGAGGWAAAGGSELHFLQ